MWAIFSENIQKYVEEKPVLRKNLMRVFTLSLAIGLLFSSISYGYFLKFKSNMFLAYTVIVIISIFIGCLISFLIFNNLLIHIRRIIYELSTDHPKWDWLEGEYIESDIRNAYLAIKKLHLTVSSQSKLIGVTQVASQVAHDIRSPLVALDMAVKNVKIPEKNRLLIQNALCRIHDIANNLLQHYRYSIKSKGSTLSDVEIESFLISMLEIILSEKRLQYQQLPISFDLIIEEGAHALFSKVNHIEFKRMISNLINNAVEAIVTTGHVTISLNQKNQYALIKITDDGQGMPSDVLEKILANNNESIISNKNSYGLGLPHAISMVKAWCGEINIKSNLGEGTTINIKLPLATPPKWLVDNISINPSQAVVIFDDDPSIHDVWRERFNIFSNNNSILYFYSYDQFINWYSEEKANLAQYLFLVDYEILHSNQTGLDLIKLLQLERCAILVTSRHEEMEVIRQSKDLGVAMLPKSILPYVPIKFNSQKYHDAVLIDDDILVHQVWQHTAQEYQKNIKTFINSNKFFLEQDRIDRNTPIYIDSNLGQDIQGEIIAKEIHKLGFQHIFLTSGMPSSHFTEISHIKGIITKSPPWKSH